MIIDSSALVEALLEAPRRVPVINAVAEAGRLLAGAPTIFETEMVMTSRRGSKGPELVEAFLEAFELVEVPFSLEHRRAATEAFTRFGKGRSPAALNFGDCLTYAIAKVEAEPLLCVGGDFARTDLELVPLD